MVANRGKVGKGKTMIERKIEKMLKYKGIIYLGNNYGDKIPQNSRI